MYTFKHTCVCVSRCIHTYTYTHIYTWVSMYIYLYACSVHIYVWIQRECICTYIHTHIYTYVYAYTYIYIYIYIYCLLTFHCLMCTHSCILWGALLRDIHQQIFRMHMASDMHCERPCNAFYKFCACTLLLICTVGSLVTLSAAQVTEPLSQILSCYWKHLRQTC
jgi:hypothetical protein